MTECLLSINQYTYIKITIAQYNSSPPKNPKNNKQQQLHPEKQQI